MGNEPRGLTEKAPYGFGGKREGGESFSGFGISRLFERPGAAGTGRAEIGKHERCGGRERSSDKFDRAVEAAGGVEGDWNAVLVDDGGWETDEFGGAARELIEVLGGERGGGMPWQDYLSVLDAGNQDGALAGTEFPGLQAGKKVLANEFDVPRVLFPKALSGQFVFLADHADAQSDQQEGREEYRAEEKEILAVWSGHAASRHPDCIGEAEA